MHIIHLKRLSKKSPSADVQSHIYVTDLINDDPCFPPIPTTAMMSDDDINENIRSLNCKQRVIYNVINKWAREYTKNRPSLMPSVIKPLYLFITGNGGCGKSHLAKTVYQSLTKTLSYHTGEPEKPKLLVLSPTGVSAVNVSGNTTHSGLGIPIGNIRKNIPKLMTNNALL